MDRGSFARLISIVKIVGSVLNSWTICDTNIVFARFFQFFVLKETDRKVTEMEMEDFIVCGCDHGKTVILFPRQVCQFRLSWVSPARCTAILVGSMVILSVCMPHSGYDEEDYITGWRFSGSSWRR